METPNTSEMDMESFELPISSLPELPEQINIESLRNIGISKLPSLKKFIPKKLPQPPKYNKNRTR